MTIIPACSGAPRHAPSTFQKDDAEKITGGSRSIAGAQAWATVASICRTARQQGRDVLGTLKTLIERSWSGQEPGFLSSG